MTDHPNGLNKLQVLCCLKFIVDYNECLVKEH